MNLNPFVGTVELYYGETAYGVNLSAGDYSYRLGETGLAIIGIAGTVEFVGSLAAETRPVLELLGRDGVDIAEDLSGDFGNLDSLRRAAVREAWRQERQLVIDTGVGTRNWTEAEIEELIQNGKVNDYFGHHINSVSAAPDLAGNPNNIRFLNWDEHFEAHNFNWQNPTYGPLIFTR